MRFFRRFAAHCGSCEIATFTHRIYFSTGLFAYICLPFFLLIQYYNLQVIIMSAADERGTCDTTQGRIFICQTAAPELDSLKAV